MSPDSKTESFWLWLLLVAAGLTLILQLFPGSWRAVASVVDVRSWSWRTYAVICGVAIVVLVAARTWIERRNE